MESLLSPPVAFGIYLLLVGVLAGAGRLLAGPGRPTEMKASLYASGEAHDTRPAAPGYKPFFLIALFFALLHLGVLLLASGGLNTVALLYALGLMLALVALILG
jgi:NADH:ubiquinone oxidoreductase subunit 3 (subunit A)